MNLFEEKRRNYKGPANQAEPTWDYFDRSARQDVSCIRSTLNEWFQLVPARHQHELKENFKSGFGAAFFELYLLRMLTNLGYEVEIHPSLPQTRHKPDFYAARGDLAFFLEATVARDESDEERRRRAVVNQFCDSLNNFHSPCFLHISRLKFERAEQLVPRRVKAFLERTFKEGGLGLSLAEPRLDPESYPTVRFQDQGVLIDFLLIPKSDEIRADPSVGTIGGQSVTELEGVKGTVRSSLLAKSTRYGELGAPYVVAVNIPSHKQWVGWHDVVEAIWGDLTLVSYGPGTRDVARRGTGVWKGPQGPQNTRLSAALVSRVHPWSMGDDRPKLFQNPWARFPLPQDALPVDLWIPEGTFKPRFSEGLLPRELVGVEAGWPKCA